MDTNIFYPLLGDSVTASKAKAVCTRCPVQEDCLAEAVTRNDEFGIQGGKSPMERRDERRQRIRSGQIKSSPFARNVVANTKHGTRTAYELHGCRCAACTRTQRDRKRQAPKPAA